jgi:hypothetical protein
MWAASDDERDQIKQAAFALAPADLLASVTEQGAELEDINAVLLLTDEDDFNALAATILAGNPEIPVYRLAPSDPSHGVVAPYTAGETLFAQTLRGPALTARHAAGGCFTTQFDGTLPPGTDLLFVIRNNGALRPVTNSRSPTIQQGDTLILLGPGQAAPGDQS